MSDYFFPEKDIAFLVRYVLSYDQLAESAQSESSGSGFFMEVLDQAQRFGRDVLATLYTQGDSNPARLTNSGVVEPAGYREVYRQYIEGGWTSLAFNPTYGGQGLPNLLAVALSEIVHTSAGISFGLCSLLSQAAIHAIEAHGSETLKQIWLPRMISGEWTGTMNLTEPAAGSDLSAVKTRAIQEGERYRIFGQKIFITWGDHQMAENIVHLVLARLPDAPSGVKGLSLFLVPKYLLEKNGDIGERNDVHCISLEEKLGLHGSPTCTMMYGENGGAIGYLVGEPNKGLPAMFTMMNLARQSVGLQGLSVSEASYQQARDYAQQRLQGTYPDGSRFNIFEFPDVKHMLLQMKALIEAMRAMVYLAGFEEDLAAQTDNETDREIHRARSALLTPIVKAWCTELAQEVTYLGLQIHGGAGYIEESGVAQHCRDARVLTIYEGTTGIQALDFVGRKIRHDDGLAINALLTEIEKLLPALRENTELVVIADGLTSALTECKEIVAWVLGQEANNLRQVQFVSVSVLMAFGYLLGGWLMAKSALKAIENRSNSDADIAFLNTKLTTSTFYMTHILNRVQALAKSVPAQHGLFLELSHDQL